MARISIAVCDPKRSLLGCASQMQDPGDFCDRISRASWEIRILSPALIRRNRPERSVHLPAAPDAQTMRSAWSRGDSGGRPGVRGWPAPRPELATAPPREQIPAAAAGPRRRTVHIPEIDRSEED